MIKRLRDFALYIDAEVPTTLAFTSVDGEISSTSTFDGLWKAAHAYPDFKVEIMQLRRGSDGQPRWMIEGWIDE